MSAHPDENIPKEQSGKDQRCLSSHTDSFNSVPL